jgi:uncharacterized membrane protein (DUF106 family)
MTLLNRWVTGLFDLVFLPFRGLDPLWGLAAVSLVAGVVMLWIFGKTSDQARIRDVRDRIRGNLIGIRLFGDDLGLLFRLQARIFRQTLTYLRHAMMPMLVLLVPVLLILVQLNLRYGARPLAVGESTVLTLQLRAASPLEEEVELSVPPGVTVETPGVRMPARREVAWRVRVDQPGRHTVTLRVGDESVDKELVAGSAWTTVSTLRTANLVDGLLYPGEPLIDRNSPIASVEVQHAALPLSLFGFGVDWLIFFFVASLASGFACRRLLGVEI